MADFQLAVNTDEKLTLIEEQVKDGYSIIIFPEGTRSQDCEIKRFHKGAFYLAEKLKLDIIPVVLHGTGYCMTKGEFLLKNGLMTIKVLERISPENLNFGEGYSQRTSKISKFFKNEYKILSEEVEDTQYFKDQLITNYLFKGPVLEWYMKVKIMLENNYKIYNEIIPKKNKILDVGCGYGFLAYMLSFTSKDREILGLDYDEEKINVAQHGFLKSQQLNFLYQDIINYQFENFDTIILSDVLHYLQPNEQETILSKCLNHISNDGMIIIRDGDGDLKERHKGTKLTELFSTKIIGFNKYTSQGLSFLNAKFLDDFALNNNLLITKIDNAKYTSNIFFILKKA
jgi:2-polyprenyl-3-methyl-5-hydroxy-6-metoxy-1,4-benzoquinol methylase